MNNYFNAAFEDFGSNNCAHSHGCKPHWFQSALRTWRKIAFLPITEPTSKPSNILFLYHSLYLFKNTYIAVSNQPPQICLTNIKKLKQYSGQDIDEIFCCPSLLEWETLTFGIFAHPFPMLAFVMEKLCWQARNVIRMAKLWAVSPIREEMSYHILYRLEPPGIQSSREQKESSNPVWNWRTTGVRFEKDELSSKWQMKMKAANVLHVWSKADDIRRKTLIVKPLREGEVGGQNPILCLYCTR